MLLASALVVGTGYQCYVLAIRLGDISFTSPFRYVGVPIAMLFGFIGWGEVRPDQAPGRPRHRRLRPVHLPPRAVSSASNLAT